MESWILFYSKYSKACLELMSFIDENGIDFPNLTTVCVDHEAVRKRLQTDKKFEIRLVPTFLKIVGSTGVASKFEGDRAFQLVASLAPPPPPPPPAALATAPPRAPSAPQISFTPLPAPSVASAPPSAPPPSSSLVGPGSVPVSQESYRQSASQAQHERHAIEREFEERRRGGGGGGGAGTTADKTPIDQILDLETIIEREEETDTAEQIQVRKGKVNAAQIMDQRNSELSKSSGPAVPVPDYTQVKTGAKVSVADIMAHQP